MIGKIGTARRSFLAEAVALPPGTGIYSYQPLLRLTSYTCTVSTALRGIGQTPAARSMKTPAGILGVIHDMYAGRGAEDGLRGRNADNKSMPARRHQLRHIRRCILGARRGGQAERETAVSAVMALRARSKVYIARRERQRMPRPSHDISALSAITAIAI
jgi:hypothetical protein